MNQHMTVTSYGPIEARYRAEAIARRARLFSPGKPIRQEKREPQETIKQDEHKWEPKPLWMLVELHFDAHVTDWPGNKTPLATPTGYIKTRCKEMGFAYVDIVGPHRYFPLMQARHAIIMEVKDAFPHLTLHALGRLFGGRDHTTILNALKMREQRIRAGVKCRLNNKHERGYHFLRPASIGQIA